MNPTDKVFFPNLDGLRFFAFFAVFVNHAVVSLGFSGNNKTYIYIKENLLKNGDLGVSFFFVLSGFLITYLLLNEKEATGKINIKNFYIRRVLRIWPVYFLVVAICLLVLPKLQNHIPGNFPIGVSTSLVNPWLYLGFAGNFDYLINGISNVLIGVLWSVSVEEQFYLFWPLIIAFVPKKYLLSTFIIVICGSIAFRYFYAKGNGMIIKFHSLSSMSDLAMGAVIAYLSARENSILRIKNIPRAVIILIYIIGFAMLPMRLIIWKLGIHYVLAASFMPILLSLFFAFIIMEQNYAEHSFYKISRWNFISSLGKYTYGMYCYHMIVFFSVLFLLHLIGAPVFGMSTAAYLCIIVTSLFSTILISVLSYHYFERIFLRFKNRF